MRRPLDALLGLLGLGLVVALVLGVVAVYQQTFVDRVRVELKTGPVGSALRVGSDVKVRGVPVGRVEHIASSGDGAVLTLAIEPDEAEWIPAASTGRLLPKTLFGERYVSLTAPASAAGGPIADGDVLEEDTSAESVELQQVLDDLLPVLQAVQPEKLAAMLGELAAFLRGQGADIGDTAVIAAEYLGELNPLVPQLADDLAALGRVAQDYSDAAPDLLAALDDFSTTSQTLVSDRRSLRDTLARVTGQADAGTGFVSANETNIVVLTRESRRALAAVRPYAEQFPCVFSALRDYVPLMDAALGAGTTEPGLHADVTVVAARGGYSAGEDDPRLGTPGRARCPRAAEAERSGGDDAQDARVDVAGPEDADLVLGLGAANSPQENLLLAELVAPSRGLSAEQFPQWGSLLLGPVLRGSELSLR